MPRSLLVKVYLWFLFAIVLTTASVALYIVLFAEDWQKRAQETVIDRVGNLRDVVSKLRAKGIAAAELDDVMQPVVDSYRATVRVLDASGNELWMLSAKKPEAPPQPVHQALVDRMKRDGPAVEFGTGREVTVALPMIVGDRPDGVFYAQARGPRPGWQTGEAQGRLLVGLGLILIVGLVLCYVLARSITAPLARMAEVAERFGSGDLGARMELSRANELRLVGDRFNHMADRIARLLDDKRRLLGDISHELKTPLARLRLSLELAKDGADAEAKGYLERGDRQVEQLAALIDELLLYSRLEAQPYAAERAPTPVAALVSEVASDPRIASSVEGGDFPLDRRLMARALGNVVHNALSHTSGAVRVGARVGSDGLVLSVEDDGPGVPDGDRARIFEPFFRADQARERTGEQGGHGLGLTIAKRCVEAHGGTIVAEAVRPDGGGLRIVIHVPIAA